MKSYQKAPNPVKGSIQILDEEALLETAGEGLLNLAVELGMETLRQMLEADVTELVGVKGKHNSRRVAYRHGTENTKVVFWEEKNGAFGSQGYEAKTVQN